jgi:hypothetical protein
MADDNLTALRGSKSCCATRQTTRPNSGERGHLQRRRLGPQQVIGVMSWSGTQGN